MGNDKLLSDLARKTLQGDEVSYRLLIKFLNQMDHPILEDIDRRAQGVQVLPMILAPISTLIMDNPKPKVHLQSIIWTTGEGNSHRVDGPAELWFDDMYIAFAINGRRHREDGPAVIDVRGEQVSYYLKGDPRTYDRGPFRVERHEGHVMMTYILSERNVKKSDVPQVLDSYDEEEQVTFRPGSHVVVTRDYVDIEGLGKSAPSDEDIRNLMVWGKNFENSIREGRRYLEDFLKKFG